jgi:hypothetical protein
VLALAAQLPFLFLRHNQVAVSYVYGLAHELYFVFLDRARYKHHAITHRPNQAATRFEELEEVPTPLLRNVCPYVDPIVGLMSIENVCLFEHDA